MTKKTLISMSAEIEVFGDSNVLLSATEAALLFGASQEFLKRVKDLKYVRVNEVQLLSYQEGPGLPTRVKMVLKLQGGPEEFSTNLITWTLDDGPSATAGFTDLLLTEMTRAMIRQGDTYAVDGNRLREMIPRFQIPELAS